MSSLILNPGSGQLQTRYERAIREARELYIVSAYLTAWDTDVRLNNKCKTFRMVVGKDFGITRKEACRQVLEWLPANHKQNFYVAAYIGGFHPKALFWKDQENKYHMLVGSSNLTEAAFQTNYEVNLYSRMNQQTYRAAVLWLGEVIGNSRPINSAWLDTYQEAKLVGRKQGSTTLPLPSDPSHDLPLPKVNSAQFARALQRRRRAVRAFNEIGASLRSLFREGAAGRLTDKEICRRFLEIWSNHRSRFQGKGWERTGINSNWRLFSRGLMSILNAKEAQRDDVVVLTIDEFAAEGLPTRKALLSEMLCHFFPNLYPVVNGPVQMWIKDMKYRAPTGASDGAKFIDMAVKMRATVTHNRDEKVRNLAELDALIWAKYGSE